MTFDDGIVKIYKTQNVAQSGDMPQIKLKLKDKYYFSFGKLGITRIYQAMQAQQQIESVINVPEWGDISMLDIAVLEDEKQYFIRTAQKEKDEDGLNITRLSLERVVDEYEYYSKNRP